MKRFAVILAVGALALPRWASAQLPARDCAAPDGGSPSNDNGQAKEAITAHNPAQALPLPPVGTEGRTTGAKRARQLRERVEVSARAQRAAASSACWALCRLRSAYESRCA